jgi:hypothetical protein
MHASQRRANDHAARRANAVRYERLRRRAAPLARKYRNSWRVTKCTPAGISAPRNASNGSYNAVAAMSRQQMAVVSRVRFNKPQHERETAGTAHSETRCHAASCRSTRKNAGTQAVCGNETNQPQTGPWRRLAKTTAVNKPERYAPSFTIHIIVLQTSERDETRRAETTDRKRQER